MRGKAGLEGLQLLMQARDFPTGLVQLGLSMARFWPKSKSGKMLMVSNSLSACPLYCQKFAQFLQPQLSLTGHIFIALSFVKSVGIKATFAAELQHKIKHVACNTEKLGRVSDDFNA